MSERGAGISAASGRDDRHWRIQHLPVLLAVSAVLLVVAAVAGGVAGGGPAAAGAAIGVAVVVAGYGLSTLVLAWADAISPQLVLPFGVALYVVKLTLLGAFMIGVAAIGWAGLVPLCIGIAVGVVGWTSAHIWWISTVYLPRRRQRIGG